MKLIAHVSHFFHPNAFVTPCPSPKISRSLYTTYKSYLYIPHSIKLMKNPSKRQSQCGFPPFRAKVRPSPPYLASAAAVPAPLLRAPWLHAPSLRALGTWIARRGPSLEAEGDGMGWVFLLWLVHGSSGFWHFELRTWSEQILRFDFTAWMVQLFQIQIPNFLAMLLNCMFTPGPWFAESVVHTRPFLTKHFLQSPVGVLVIHWVDGPSRVR